MGFSMDVGVPVVYRGFYQGLLSFFFTVCPSACTALSGISLRRRRAGRTVRKTGAAVCQYDLFCDRDQLRIFYDGTWCVGSRKFS